MKINVLTYKIAAMAVCIFFFIQIANSQISESGSEKFDRLMFWINNSYVDTINEYKLIEHAIIETLKELDPHSSYIPKEEVRTINESLRGNFEGIGIWYNILNDSILVISTIPGGPSDELGILAGDRIVKVDNEVVAGIGIKSEGVRQRLMGDKGSKVLVYIKRKGFKDLLEFNITRDKIPIYSIDAAFMIDDINGYIKLNRFSATTIREFRAALSKLKKHGLKNLILDLQNNGGGYLSSATDLADEFLQSEKMIVYTEGVNNPKNEYYATSRGEFENGKLVVLTDEGTASASEIVTGAVQDWDRGIVVGRRSFGKGLVQRAFYFRDGSMIRLTIARYYTPSGRLIQKPYNHGTSDYRKDIERRYLHGEFVNKDSIHFNDSLKYNTLISKRTVYGGGGIMPDVFVPMDTSQVSNYYSQLLRKGYINKFVLVYIDKYRKQLEKQYPDFENFKNEFSIDNSLFSEFEKFVRNEEANQKIDSTNTNTADNSAVDSVKTAPEKSINDKLFDPGNTYAQLFENDLYMKMQLKALIARDLWALEQYYQIIKNIDPSFMKALILLQNEEKYSEILR